MAKHEHGSMDTTAQVAAFNGFMRGAVIVGVISIAILLFLAVVGT